MDDLPRQKLAELIRRFGREVAGDARRCEALLKDSCPQHKREIFVLVSAARESVGTELLGGSNGMPQEVLLSRLARRLHENLGLTESLARWAVESWALALENAGSAGQEGFQVEFPQVAATIVHMHHEVGSLADLILPEDIPDTTTRICVGFADPAQPSRQLKSVLLDISRDPDDPVRYFRLSGLRLGNEWWDDEHPVVLRVYRRKRIAAWLTADAVPSRRLLIRQPPLPLVSGESLGYQERGKFIAVISADSRVPCAATRHFKTSRDFQLQITVKAAVASDRVRLLGASLLASVAPAPAGKASIECVFRVDQDGRVTLKAESSVTSFPTVVIFG